jgi:hypothetical protein
VETVFRYPKKTLNTLLVRLTSGEVKRASDLSVAKEAMDKIDKNEIPVLDDSDISLNRNSKRFKKHSALPTR